MEHPVETAILNPVRGWLVSLDIEDVKRVLSGFRYCQNQGDLISRSLKIGNADVVNAICKVGRARLGRQWMNAVVIYDRLFIDGEDRTVVGYQTESIPTRFRNPKPSLIVNGKPFEAIRNAWEPIEEISNR